MKLTVYMDGDLPAGFKKLADRAEDISSAFRSMSKGNFVVEFERPGAGLNDTAKAMLFDSLQLMGINATNVKAQQKDGEKTEETLVFPGAILSGEKGQVGIDFLEGQSNFNGLESLNNAEALMEFKIAKAIMLLKRDAPPLVGYLAGNGQPLDLSVYDLIENVMRKDYYFKILPIDSVAAIPQDFKAIVIAKPSIPFSREQRLKIDQYVMHGGKIIWAIDQLYASMDSLQRSSGSFVAYDQGLELDEQLFKYGVRVNLNLVQDLNCAKLPMVVGIDASGAPTIQRVPWPYYPFAQAGSEHPMVQNMDRVLTAFPASLDTVRALGITKTILLTTDTTSRIISSPTMIQLNSGQQEGELASFTKQHIPVAVLLEGQFKSAFTGRLTSSLMDSVQLATGKAFITNGIKAAKQIVLSDADLITNFVDAQKGPLPMGMIPYEGVQFANPVFFQNAIAYLNEPISLLEARKKNLVLRRLDAGKVAENRLWIQLVLLLGPLFLLGLGYWGAYYSRQSRFAVSKS